MSESNNPIDDKIRRALAEDDKWIDVGPVREQGIFEMMLGMYRGRLLWLNLIVSVFQLLFMVLAIWSAFSFFDATEVREQIMYATLFLWGVGVTGMFKIWFWMVMNRNSMIREVKRLELQVAELSQSLEHRRL